MSRRIFNKPAVFVIIALCACLNAGAQAYGSYTPYSIFGVGDLRQPGTAYNKSMGGVGIASRNNRFINITNPAAVTARDSLAFMTDFSIYGDNKIFRQNDITSASNTLNINNCVISFPIYKSSAMMVGIMPYSDSGYGYSFYYTDPSIIGNTGNITYQAYGTGSIYKIFAGGGVTFWKRFSVGAELDYYFGSLEKYSYLTFTDTSHNDIHNENTLQVSGLGGKLGLQYEQPLGSKLTLGLGATYSTGAGLRGYLQKASYSYGKAASDTLKFTVDTLGHANKTHFAGEIGLGVSLKFADRWRVEFDYSRSDWTNTGILNIGDFSNSSTCPFSPAVAQSYRLGFEIVPNRNDIRYYFNRIAYRGGAYYRDEYYKVDGKQISSAGITIGATLPIYRWYNGLTLGLDFGQRGSLSGGQIMERYVNFSIGFNLFDIWFQKSMYE